MTDEHAYFNVNLMVETLVFYPQFFCFLWHCIVWHKDDPIFVRGKCCIHPMSKSSWINIMYGGMDQLIVYISLGLLGIESTTNLVFVIQHEI